MQTTLRIRGHDDDVNAVAFLDDSSNLIASGSDDTLIKVTALLYYHKHPFEPALSLPPGLSETFIWAMAGILCHLARQNRHACVSSSLGENLRKEKHCMQPARKGPLCWICKASVQNHASLQFSCRESPSEGSPWFTHGLTCYAVTHAGVGQESAAGEQACRRPGRAHRGPHASGLPGRRPLPALQLQGPDRPPLGYSQGGYPACTCHLHHHASSRAALSA